MRTSRYLALAAALMTLAACRDRTYVLVTVDADSAVAGQVTQLRFESRLVRETETLTSDEQAYPKSNGATPVRFPNSFVVLADDRGKDGETLEVFVEAFDANGALVARSRGTAPVVAGSETSVQLTIGSPCQQNSECFEGGAFCDNPVLCNCEGANCLEGFCERIPLDDGNSCTVTECDEEARTVDVVNLNDGTECIGTAGETLVCAGGFCGCGDGLTNPDLEECDQGNLNANEPNRCRRAPACTIPRCGDGIVDDGAPFFEECDDGDANSLAPNACRPNCKLPACGDDIVDDGEECDEGPDNNDALANQCRTSCLLPSCGDGVVDVGFAFGVFNDEQCDDPAGNSNTNVDGCRQSVTLENGTGATLSCRTAFCGDGVVDSGELCDDNNSANGDGCNPTCNLLGSVAKVIGDGGGPGSQDGTGSGASLTPPLLDMVVEGGWAYFTRDPGTELHKIRRVNLTTGEVQSVAGDGDVDSDDGAGTAASFNQPRGIASDGTFLYIADRGNHVIRRMNLTTFAVETVAGSAGSSGDTDSTLANSRFDLPTYIAVRDATELLVMDKDCRLRRVDLMGDSVTTLVDNAGCFFPANSDLGTPEFALVRGMAMGPEPYLYVSDSEQIRRVELDTVYVDTLAGGFLADYVDDVGALAAFNGPRDLAISGTTLYVADSGNNAIRAVDTSDGTTSTVALVAPIAEPTALGVSGSTLLVSEAGRPVILAGVDLASPPVDLQPLAGSEPTGLSELGAIAIAFDSLYIVDRAALAARLLRVALDDPAYAIDDLGNANGSSGSTDDFIFALSGTTTSLYGLYGNPNVVREIDEDGVAVGAPINPKNGSGGDPGVSPSTGFRGLVAFDGELYATETNTSVLIQVTPVPPGPAVVAGVLGVAAVSDAVGTEARFIAPWAVIECAGSLYVSETIGPEQSHVVRRIDMSGSEPVVTTLAGSPTNGGHRDGIGGAARFDFPIALACDGTSLYVADRNSSTIRQVELATGRVTTLAGSAYQTGSVEDVGAAARFESPAGLVWDEASGTLFVTDSVSNVVYQIQ